MMMAMKTVLLIAALALGAPAAYAAEPPPALGQAERDLREGLAKVFRAIEGFVRSIPVYEAPYIDENGDIIIRRKHREREEEDRGAQPDDTARI
jgi:hypothetical protein